VSKNNKVTAAKNVAGSQVGEFIEQLSERSKAILINGKKLNVSPSNQYLEETV
jgi:hypothetical protein